MLLTPDQEAIRDAVAWIGKNETEARKTQITYLKLPEAVAMSVPLPVFAIDVSAKEVQYWVDLCREFGITKGTSTVAQLLFQ